MPGSAQQHCTGCQRLLAYIFFRFITPANSGPPGMRCQFFCCSCNLLRKPLIFWSWSTSFSFCRFCLICCTDLLPRKSAHWGPVHCPVVSIMCVIATKLVTRNERISYIEAQVLQPPFWSIPCSAQAGEWQGCMSHAAGKMELQAALIYALYTDRGTRHHRRSHQPKRSAQRLSQ